MSGDSTLVVKYDTDRCMSTVNITSIYITIPNENTDINN